jgi:tight adherence protein B
MSGTGTFDTGGAMAGRRYVVLGLAGVRSPWFRDVGRWATAATVPIEFVRCVSAEELVARLDGGRTFSALLVDAGAGGLDRDLLDRARVAGLPAFVVGDSRTGRDWISLGATAVLAADLGPAELMDELHRHGQPVDRVGDTVGGTGDDAVRTWSGRLVAVTGGRGAGASTLAMATAQGLADDPRHRGSVLLADLALHADQAMYHDARDIVPGLQEVVDAHRTGTPTPTELRTMVFDAPERGYHLLLGLRRHRDWAALRPRAVEAALANLTAGYRFVIADIEPDLEGEDEVGAVEVEERNLLARATMQRADLVLVVGTPDMKGLHDLIRTIADIVGFGTEPGRIVPVINRSARPGRPRAEISAAFADLPQPRRLRPPRPLLADDDVWEIMINAPDEIFVKRHTAQSGYHDEVFHDDEHVVRTLTKILDDASGAHRKLDPSEGLQDAQLDDGARLHIVHRDIGRGGHLMVNIRKFTGVAFRTSTSWSSGHAEPRRRRVPAGRVRARLSIVFAGRARVGQDHPAVVLRRRARPDPAGRRRRGGLRGRRPAAERRLDADPRRRARPARSTCAASSPGSCAWRPTSPSSARSATARRCRCCSPCRRASRGSPPSTPARPARRSPGCGSSASSPTPLGRAAAVGAQRTRVVNGALMALVGGLGVFYLYTALAYRWHTLRPTPEVGVGHHERAGATDRWLMQAGLDGVDGPQFAAATAALFALGAIVAYAMFGGVVPALVAASFLATVPVTAYRNRRRRRLARAHDSWPRMIEEIRVMTGATGRSIPQALFEVGRRAPDELRPAFDAAHREWLLTTDFERTLDVLKERLADATADATCETLLMAHQLGGTDLDHRLVALADDRRTDAQGRKDAIARQAGARFARWFTIVVPVGMGAVGMSIGDGRAAYRTDYGQVMVVVALALTVVCWVAASMIMRLPDEQRVFPERARSS